MPKKMSLGDNSSREFPVLLDTKHGPVLGVDYCAFVAADGDGFSQFEDAECTEKCVASQQDREQVSTLIQLLDEVRAFDSIHNAAIPRCLELSYLIELAGHVPVFWSEYTAAWADEFLDQTFPGLTGYSVDDALQSVKSLEEWPTGREYGAEKIRFIIQAGAISVGILSFTTRGIVFHHRVRGSEYTFYLGFSDYEELGTDVVGEYDWYAACWKHLFYQLLAACGVRCDDLQFFCAKDAPPFDMYYFEEEEMKPFRVSNPASLLERLDAYLAQWKDTKLVY